MVFYDVFHLQLHFIRIARSLHIFIAVIVAGTSMCGKIAKLLNDNEVFTMRLWIIPMVNCVDARKGVPYVVTTCNQMKSSAKKYFLNGNLANHIAQQVKSADYVDECINQWVGGWKGEPAMFFFSVVFRQKSVNCEFLNYSYDKRNGKFHESVLIAGSL